MHYDKDVYEELIDLSPLFSLNKEEEYAAYRREALKMVEYLYCYLMAVNMNRYEPYALEIVDTAKRCIENYDQTSGRFLNYFTSAWKQNYGHIVGRELVKETFKGIHFTDEDERSFRKYMRFAQNMGINTEAHDFDERVAEVMGITACEVSDLKSMVNCKPTSARAVNDKGEEYSLIDQLDSGNYVDSRLLQLETTKEFLDLVEDTYDQLQERQKPMLAMFITSKLALLAGEDAVLMEYVREKAFFNEVILEESIERGEQILAKEIAERVGVSEASASRSWKTFREKLEAREKSK